MTTELESAPDAFSIFWISDTQFLSESNPALFRMTTRWIADNWKTHNGRLVVHTGDIVQTGGQQTEWENADKAMGILLENGIPYSWCAGNHDDLTIGQPDSGWMGRQWTAAFNASNVGGTVFASGSSRWVSDFHDGMNTAVSFSANGLDFLVISVEWNADSGVLGWVKGLLEDPAHASHKVIIAPHAYINSTGSTDDPAWGPQTDDFPKRLTSLMDEHSSNVFLTLNGHFPTDQGYFTPNLVSNRNQLMFDRQDCTDYPSSPSGRGVDGSDPSAPNSDKVGGATVAVLTFDTKNNQISVRTHDVFAGKWRDEANERYTIAMLPAPAVQTKQVG